MALETEYLEYKAGQMRLGEPWVSFSDWRHKIKGVEASPDLVMLEAPIQSVSDARKATPIYAGFLQYFPDAVAAVARLSKKANDKHNPGEPLGWSRHKSSDHAECIIRHQMNPAEIDPEFGELHAVAVAWRAMAQLQLLEEKRLGK